jgi:hypothetical protein
LHNNNQGHNDLSGSNALEQMVQIPLQEKNSTATKLHIISHMLRKLHEIPREQELVLKDQNTMHILTQGFYELERV